MNTQSEYKILLDGAFQRHIPQWERLSPLDPTKVLAESLALAMGAIEQRQRRMIDTVLDSLPSLFSVKPKPGRLPVGLFRVTPASHLNDTIELNTAQRIRVQEGERNLDLIPHETLKVFPLSDFESKVDGKVHVLRFRSRGRAANLVLQFVPRSTEISLPRNRVVSLEVLVTGVDGIRSASNLLHFRLEEDTDEFTRYGNIILTRLDRAPFFTQSGEIEIRVQFAQSAAGEFAANVFPFEIGESAGSLSLGFLKGDAWEEVPLPGHLIETPRALCVQYPDGPNTLLHRLADDILLERLQSPEAFQRGFFYHGAHHSLILPSGDLLMGHYHGGLEITMIDGLFVPQPDWPADGAQILLGDLAASIEEIIPIRSLLKFVPAESSQDYLARFYSELRAFHGECAPLPAVLIDELETQLLSQEPTLRQIEIEVDDEKKELRAFCLAEEPSLGEAFRLDRELALRIEKGIGERVPLHYRYQVGAFSPARCSIYCNVVIELSESRLAQVSGEDLEESLGEFFRKMLLPPPFGNLARRVAIDKKAFEQCLREFVGLDTKGLAGHEIESIDLTLRDGHGEFVDQLRREAGECLIPSVTTRVSVRVAPPSVQSTRQIGGRS